MSEPTTSEVERAEADLRMANSIHAAGEKLTEALRILASVAADLAKLQGPAPAADREGSR